MTFTSMLPSNLGAHDAPLGSANDRLPVVLMRVVLTPTQRVFLGRAGQGVQREQLRVGIHYPGFDRNADIIPVADQVPGVEVGHHERSTITYAEHRTGRDSRAWTEAPVAECVHRPLACITRIEKLLVGLDRRTGSQISRGLPRPDESRSCHWRHRVTVTLIRQPRDSGL